MVHELCSKKQHSGDLLLISYAHGGYLWNDTTDCQPFLVLTLVLREVNDQMPGGALRPVLVHPLHFSHLPPLYLLHSILRI